MPKPKYPQYKADERGKVYGPTARKRSDPNDYMQTKFEGVRAIDPHCIDCGDVLPDGSAHRCPACVAIAWEMQHDELYRVRVMVVPSDPHSPSTHAPAVDAYDECQVCSAPLPEKGAPCPVCNYGGQYRVRS